ncbi:MAG: pseudouridine synthase [Pseudomonadales bacterium]|jgi:tRNA pseudouridine32 synthase/23S rRNA pseudouridine746 synthase|tara:strand:+ start:4724 stop:5356 length:633 start_codon:yes stop_codon:yes gene_type:complete
MRRGDVKDWVIFQDEHLLVMNKPAGLFTTPGRFEKHCLLGVARALRAEAEVVHRLDLDTSGLVVFGCSKPAISGLNRLFRERRIEKQYVALVAGTSSAESGEIAFPLGPDRLRRPRQRVNWRHGKAALTRYRVLETALAHSRLALTPVTGVRHQLRLHLALIGLPIIGCDLYAPTVVRQAGARLMLHAQQLTFEHPVTRAPFVFQAPVDF